MGSKQKVIKEISRPASSLIENFNLGVYEPAKIVIT